MIYVLLSHPVQDFDTWRPVFDSDQARAAAAGIRNVKLLRGLENPNEVSIFCSVPSKEALDSFVNDPTLPELMKKAGVLAPPTIQIFHEN